MQYNHVSIDQIILQIDHLISSCLEQVFSNKHFTSLLNLWSSILFLLQDTNNRITLVKILCVCMEEVAQYEGETSLILYKLLYELEMPGSDPISVVIFDQEIDFRDKKHIKILEHLGYCASTAYCPFLFSVNHNFITQSNIDNLDKITINKIKNSSDLAELKKFCKQQDSIFTGAVVSKIYISSILEKLQVERFLDFNCKKYHSIKIGGNFGLCNIISKCHDTTGWFTHMFGFSDNKNKINYGNINGINHEHLLKEYFSCEDLGYLPKTELYISEYKAKELSDLGIIAFCNIKRRKQLLLFSAKSLHNFGVDNPSAFEPKNHLQYILCICKFVHYLKQIGRQKIGHFSNKSEFEHFLNMWLQQHIAVNANESLALQMRYPLQGGKIDVQIDPFTDHQYICKMFIQPHFTASAHTSSSIVLKTNISS